MPAKKRTNPGPSSGFDDQVRRRYAAYLAQAEADPDWRKAEIVGTRHNLANAQENARVARNDVDVLGAMNQQANVGGYVPMTRATTQAARAARPGQKPYTMAGTWANESGVQEAFLRMLLANLSGGNSGGVRRM